MLNFVKMSPLNDLRGAVRFPLHLHVDLRDNKEDLEAETQDISAGGVLIHCAVDYPVGSTIQFSISMPAKSMRQKNVRAPAQFRRGPHPL